MGAMPGSWNILLPGVLPPKHRAAVHKMSSAKLELPMTGICTPELHIGIFGDHTQARVMTVPSEAFPVQARVVWTRVGNDLVRNASWALVAG